MKKVNSSANQKLWGFLLMLSLLISACAEQNKQQEQAAPTTQKEMKAKKEKLLRHMVIFKFKDSTSAAQVDQLNQSFVALQEHIPVIQDFEWGLNDSPEDFHQGFTHCYLLSFNSEADRDSVYSPHPKHQAFVASLQPHLEKVFVVDYWAN